MTELSEEQKKVLEEQKKQCPFCQIVDGKIPSKKVYEDDKILAILDINPAVKGHTLVMPKEHYPIMPIIPKETFQHIFKIVRDISKSVRKALVSQGSNVFIANGGVAGQQSGHFMIHVIPRDKNDGVGIELKKGKIDSSKLDELEKMLKHNLPLMLRDFLAKHPLPGQEVPKAEFGKEQIIQIIEKNPQILELIKKNPEAFKQAIPGNEQLKSLFEKVDVDEIISHFTGVVEAEFEEIDSEEEINDEEKQTKKKAKKSTKKKLTKKKATKNKKAVEKKTSKPKDDEASLDDIARLFS